MHSEAFPTLVTDVKSAVFSRRHICVRPLLTVCVYLWSERVIRADRHSLWCFY
jgi:hypothetical protein